MKASLAGLRPRVVLLAFVILLVPAFAIAAAGAIQNRNVAAPGKLSIEALPYCGDNSTAPESSGESDNAIVRKAGTQYCQSSIDAPQSVEGVPSGTFWQLGDDLEDGPLALNYSGTATVAAAAPSAGEPQPRRMALVLSLYLGFVLAATVLLWRLTPARRIAATPHHVDPIPRPEPPNPQPKPLPAARSVELAASTASGVSGLTVDRGRSGSFDVYAATQVGLQHAKGGHPREDAYALGGDEKQGWVFVAVADGLGSTSNAHAAARCAVTTALAALRRGVAATTDPSPHQWRQIADDVIMKVATGLDPSAVDFAADEIGYRSPRYLDGRKSARAPACTLTFAAIGRPTTSGYTLLWGGVGDCDLLILNSVTGNLSWKTNNVTKNGSSVSNVTDSLPKDVDRAFNGAETVQPDTIVLVASDGVSDAIRQVPEQFSRLLRSAATTAVAEHTFAELVAFDLPGLHDDRTLVAVWPVSNRDHTRAVNAR